jgi:hypothetical protein
MTYATKIKIIDSYTYFKFLHLAMIKMIDTNVLTMPTDLAKNENTFTIKDPVTQ